MPRERLRNDVFLKDDERKIMKVFYGNTSEAGHMQPYRIENATRSLLEKGLLDQENIEYLVSLGLIQVKKEKQVENSTVEKMTLSDNVSDETLDRYDPEFVEILTGLYGLDGEDAEGYVSTVNPSTFYEREKELSNLFGGSEIDTDTFIVRNLRLLSCSDETWKKYLGKVRGVVWEHARKGGLTVEKLPTLESVVTEEFDNGQKEEGKKELPVYLDKTTELYLEELKKREDWSFTNAQR